MIVFVKSTGGQLANRLLTFAHIYAFCREHGFKMIHIGFEEYAPFFESTRYGSHLEFPATAHELVAPSRRKRKVKMLRLGMSALMKLPCTSSFLVSQSVAAMGDPFPMDTPEFLASLREKKILRLEGFVLRAETLFAKHIQEIRAYFTPEKTIAERVKSVVASARTSCDLLVGVHIRRGDYKHFEGGKYYFEIEQYAGVMRSALDLFPNRKVRFLICSNEKLSQEQFKNLDVAFGPGQPVEDLYTLASCDYLLGTRSTFGMWASIYGSVPAYFICEPARRPALKDFVKHGSHETAA